mgnify:CR=1 FL=1
MATKVFIDSRYLDRGKAFVSISPSLGRLVIYKEAYTILKDNYGQDIDFVQILTDDERKEIFWVKPCTEEAPGSRKWDSTSTNTRAMSIRALIKVFKLEDAETIKIPLEWDDEEMAGRIDLSKKISRKSKG